MASLLKMKAGSPFTAQAGFHLSILLPQPEVSLLNNKKKYDSSSENNGTYIHTFISTHSVC